MYPITDIATFRACLRRQWKARSAVNGPVLYQERNAPMVAQARSLRAARKAVLRGVMSLGKGAPFPARQALRLTAFRAAECYNISDGVH
ncbi:MAG: hypothetical protein MAG794_00676 [Gammaproteobacteria bacterium]|nr:hypothetical protein [Gammaproteobacteria bacterium]